MKNEKEIRKEEGKRKKRRIEKEKPDCQTSISRRRGKSRDAPSPAFIFFSLSVVSFPSLWFLFDRVFSTVLNS